MPKAIMAIWCVCFCGMPWRAIGQLSGIPFGTSYSLFARWTRPGLCRLARGDAAQPSTVVIDSRTCLSASSCFPRGVDGGKKIRGVKVSIAVEKYGIPLAIDAMRYAGTGGSIFNIASILGIRVAGQVSSYIASKGGLVHLTKAMALELARHGIRVNALCPGYVETDLNQDFFASDPGKTLIRRIPQYRPGRLDEPMLLPCSAAGSYMTGSVIAVDGGHLVSSF